jgi:hypothetical protein
LRLLQESPGRYPSRTLRKSNLPKCNNAAAYSSCQANRETNTDCEKASGNVSRIAAKSTYQNEGNKQTDEKHDGPDDYGDEQTK